MIGRSRPSVLRQVVRLFLGRPELVESLTVIGGVAATLRLIECGSPDVVRGTVDIDIVARPPITPEQLKSIVAPTRIDVLTIDASGMAGPLPKEVVDVVWLDRDVLAYEGARVPVVGPIGLLVTKLNRSGTHGTRHARGRDLLDVALVLTEAAALSKSRFAQLRGLPVVAGAMADFAELMRGDTGAGVVEVVREMDADPNSMEFILFKARIDALLADLAVC